MSSENVELKESTSEVKDAAAEPPQVTEEEQPPPAEPEPPQAAEAEPPQPAEAEPPQPAEAEQPPPAEAKPPQVAEVSVQDLKPNNSTGVDSVEATRERTSIRDTTNRLSTSRNTLPVLTSESKFKIQFSGADKKKVHALGSVISFRRGNVEYYDRQKAPKYMNSYKLDSDKPFNTEKVELILKDVLAEAIENLTYDSDKVLKQAKWASSAIRAKVKEQEFDRYKIITLVTIGEKRSQDMYTIMRFLWDADRDKFARHTAENMNVFAIGLCFGIYYE